MDQCNWSASGRRMNKQRLWTERLQDDSAPMQRLVRAVSRAEVKSFWKQLKTWTSTPSRTCAAKQTHLHTCMNIHDHLNHTYATGSHEYEVSVSSTSGVPLLTATDHFRWTELIVNNGPRTVQVSEIQRHVNNSSVNKAHSAPSQNSGFISDQQLIFKLSGINTVWL